MPLNTDSPLPTLDRQHLLDPYHQHTRLCSSCRQALTRIQQFQIGFPICFASAHIIGNFGIVLPTLKSLN